MIEALASSPEGRDWPSLRSAILKIYQLKCEGKPYRDQVTRLQAVLSRYEEDFIPYSKTKGNRIVIAYYLDKIGLHFRESWDSLAQSVRAEALSLPSDATFESLETLFFAYALAHVIFTKSDYYGRYVRAADFEPEIKAIRKCLRALLEEDLNDKTMDIAAKLDIAAELVAALKLLGQPIEGDARKVSERLIALQNADGSWGSEDPKSHPTARIHHTGVAVSALLQFTATPRTRDPWCESQWR